MSRRDDEFTAFVQQHREELLRVAYANVGGWARAEDVLQAALVKLYRAWGRVASDTAYAYARRIVLNARTDEWRRPWRREVAAGDGLPERAGPDEAARLVERLDLVAALTELPVRQRQVVVTRYYCQLSVEETAHELGLSAGTVKSHCHRAVARLNELLRTVDLTLHDERPLSGERPLSDEGRVQR